MGEIREPVNLLPCAATVYDLYSDQEYECTGYDVPGHEVHTAYAFMSPDHEYGERIRVTLSWTDES